MKSISCTAWSPGFQTFWRANHCQALIHLADPLHNCTEMNLQILFFHAFLWADYGPTQALAFHSLSCMSLEVLSPLPDGTNNSGLSANHVQLLVGSNVSSQKTPPVISSISCLSVLLSFNDRLTSFPEENQNLFSFSSLQPGIFLHNEAF